MLYVTVLLAMAPAMRMPTGRGSQKHMNASCQGAAHNFCNVTERLVSEESTLLRRLLEGSKLWV